MNRLCVLGLVCFLAQVKLLGAQGFPGYWKHTFFTPRAFFTVPSSLADSLGSQFETGAAKPLHFPGLKSFYGHYAGRLAGKASVAIGFSKRGNEYWRETGLSLALGRKLSPSIALGIGITYFRERLPGYGSRLSLQPVTSIQWTGGLVRAGAFLQLRTFRTSENPAITGITRSVLLTGGGLGVSWSPYLFTEASLALNNQSGAGTHWLLLFQPHTSVSLSAFLQTAPLRYGLESGYQVRAYRLLITGSWQPPLGWTPGLSLQFSGKKRSR